MISHQPHQFESKICTKLNVNVYYKSFRQDSFNMNNFGCRRFTRPTPVIPNDVNQTF